MPKTRDCEHYLRLLRENPYAGIGFTLAASAVYAARYGSCEPEHRNTEEWKRIARDLKARYGETLTGIQVIAEQARATAVGWGDHADK